MARVVVLLGGLSAERRVSLVSGGACAAALRRLGHDVAEIDPQDPHWPEAIKAFAPTHAFNALHGEWGEDGRMQGVLEYLRIPYTHSGVLASALAMDKQRAKTVLAAAGLDVPAGRLMNRAELAGGHPIAPPYVVKPNAQGSSVGVVIVRPGGNQPPAELTGAEWTFGDEVLVEEFIPGRELTTAVLGDRALAVTEILPMGEWYDYDAKYAEGGSRHVVPAEIPADVTERCLRAALDAHNALGCRGLSRTDFRYDPATGRVVVLEVNTQPGMTPTSLAPEQAAHLGMGFEALVGWMLEDASCPR